MKQKVGKGAPFQPLYLADDRPPLSVLQMEERKRLTTRLQMAELQKSPAFRAWTAQKNGARQRDRATIWAVRALVGAAWVALLLFLGWRLLLSVEQPHETSNMSQQLPFLESGPDIAEQLTFPEGTYQEMPSGLADQPDVDFLAPAVEPEAVTSTIGEAGQTTGADAVPEPAFLDSCLQEEAEAVSVPPVELQLVSLPRLSLLEMAARCAGIPLAIAACIFLARTLTLHQILSAWSGLLNHAQRLRKASSSLPAPMQDISNPLYDSSEEGQMVKLAPERKILPAMMSPGTSPSSGTKKGHEEGPGSDEAWVTAMAQDISNPLYNDDDEESILEEAAGKDPHASASGAARDAGSPAAAVAELQQEAQACIAEYQQQQGPEQGAAADNADSNLQQESGALETRIQRLLGEAQEAEARHSHKEEASRKALDDNAALVAQLRRSAPESESPPKHKCLPAIEHAESPGQQEASEKDEVLAHAEQGLAELRSLLQEEAQASVELLTALEELKDEADREKEVAQVALAEAQADLERLRAEVTDLRGSLAASVEERDRLEAETARLHGALADVGVKLAQWQGQATQAAEASSPESTTSAASRSHSISRTPSESRTPPEVDAAVCITLAPFDSPMLQLRTSSGKALSPADLQPSVRERAALFQPSPSANGSPAPPLRVPQSMPYPVHPPEAPASPILGGPDPESAGEESTQTPDSAHVGSSDSEGHSGGEHGGSPAQLMSGDVASRPSSSSQPSPPMSGLMDEASQTGTQDGSWPRSELTFSPSSKDHISAELHGEAEHEVGSETTPEAAPAQQDSSAVLQEMTATEDAESPEATGGVEIPEATEEAETPEATEVQGASAPQRQDSPATEPEGLVEVKNLAQLAGRIDATPQPVKDQGTAQGLGVAGSGGIASPFHALLKYALGSGRKSEAAPPAASTPTKDQETPRAPSASPSLWHGNGSASPGCFVAGIPRDFSPAGFRGLSPPQPQS